MQRWLKRLVKVGEKRHLNLPPNCFESTRTEGLVGQPIRGPHRHTHQADAHTPNPGAKK
jgi:hypothetical protein